MILDYQQQLLLLDNTLKRKNCSVKANTVVLHLIEQMLERQTKVT